MMETRAAQFTVQEDLGLKNHLVGLKNLYLKLLFHNVQVCPW